MSIVDIDRTRELRVLLPVTSIQWPQKDPGVFTNKFSRQDVGPDQWNTSNLSSLCAPRSRKIESTQLDESSLWSCSNDSKKAASHPDARSRKPNESQKLCKNNSTSGIAPINNQFSSAFSLSPQTISPYQAKEGRSFYPTVNLETSSTGPGIGVNFKRHFRRRVAQYHQNQRRSVQTSNERPNMHDHRTGKQSDTNSFLRLIQARKSQTMSALSQLHLNESGSTTFEFGEKTEILKFAERRSFSLGPSVSQSRKSFVSSSVPGHISVIDLGNPISGWTNSLVQPNRALSTPLVIQETANETRVDMDAQYVSRTFRQDQLTRNCAVRSRSHHQLASEQQLYGQDETNRLCELSKANGPTSPIKSPQTNVTDSKSMPLVDRWDPERLPISIQSDFCSNKFMRSPISVLAPCKGKLHLKVENQDGVIHISEIEAKGLRSSVETGGYYFVKVDVLPDKTQILNRQTGLVEGTSNPVFNESITLDLSKSKHARRILLTAFVQHSKEGKPEFLGGMSFGVAGIISKKQVVGWYYLLNETMCRKKHLKAGLDLHSLVNLAETDNSDGGKLVIPDGTGLAAVKCSAVGTPLVPVTVAAASSHISPTVINKQSYLIQSPTSKTINQLSQPMPTYSTPSFRTARPQNRQPTNNAQYFHFLLQRGPKGFGFTLAGDSPVYVSHVEQGSPANQCGVKAGDTIVAVDRMNVSRSTADSVVRLFRTARNPVYFTVCRPITVQMQLPSVNRSSSGTRTISCLFQKSCFSQSKKSTSDNMVGSGNGFHANCHSSPGLNYPHQSSSPAYLLAPTTPFTATTSTTTYQSCPLNNQIQPSPQTTHNHLSNSRSFYQLSMVPETPRTCLRNSKTEDRLCDQYYNASSPCAIAVNVTQDEMTTKPKQTILPPSPAAWEAEVNTILPVVSSKDSSRLDVVSLPTLSSPTTQLSNTGSVFNLPTQPSATKSTLPCLTVLMNSKVALTGIEQTPFTVDCLKYVHHVKHVDFCVHSPKLEHYGCLNLLESNCCSKVDLLMFADLLLIAQRAPNRYFTVIKDPIYNSKVCYVNIPPYASDQLILQYIDDSNRKQIVHFQGPNVLEWFDWIQGHMVYNGNWWMGNM
ncbi:hypothetical protein EG68_03592 [Paragonimus skrjabini miyazakii]|uniref:Regulator of G-protein signaling 3 n=1 Tax=Paragonimus skrjabini miyazakii TaxID=59628 RepID=A0A8S9YVQ7_9TREM|nr:hypothetical protein EG68_03592 [Paragonimus skrjabini miyazakii]